MQNILIRWDDVYQTMDKKKFDKLVAICESYSIPCILGITSHNKFLPAYEITYSKKDFWKEIKRLEENGWQIALHGYTHEHLGGGGFLNINTKGEFGDLTFKEAHNRISKAVQELKHYHITPTNFIAPWHSYNENTIKALAKNNIFELNDGHHIFPYYKHKVLITGQQATMRFQFYPFFGTYTICLHPSTMTTAEIKQFENFVKKYHERITTKPTYKKLGLLQKTMNSMSEKLVMRVLRLIQKRASKK